MYNNMKRKSPKYVRIENYNSWEFTNNIAYELTIRTQKYNHIKGHLDALVNIMKRDYEKINTKEAINTDILSEKISNEKTKVSYQVNLDQEYEQYLNTVSKRINNMNGILLSGYKELGLNMLHELSDELNEFIYNSKIVRGNTIETLITNRKIFIDSITQEFNQASDSLYLSFERPKISFPSTPKAHIDINTNMKKKELIEYVTEIINRNYKEEPKLICEADIFPELLDTLKYEHHKESYKGKRFADLFFIYDYTKCKQKEGKEHHAIITLKDEIKGLKSHIGKNTFADTPIEYSYSSEELNKQIKEKELELEKEEKYYFMKNILKEEYLQKQLNHEASYLEKEYKRINSLIRNYSNKKLI